MAAPARAGAWKSRTAAARMAAGMAATTSATEAERDSAAAVGDMQEEDAVATLVGAGCAGAAPYTVVSRVDIPAGLAPVKAAELPADRDSRCGAARRERLRCDDRASNSSALLYCTAGDTPAAAGTAVAAAA
eukprot:scaffold22147_cov120-Isochrysis_galbana.AAC.5